MAETLKRVRSKQASASTLVRYAVKGIEEKKGNAIVCINLKKIPNTACDYFVICEGNSRTQVQAIAGSVEDIIEKHTGVRPWHVEGMENGEWVLLDYVDIAIHVFQPHARSFYNLENMWADAEMKNINGEKRNVKKKKSITKKKKVKSVQKKNNKRK